MTSADVILQALGAGPASAVALECALVDAGYAGGTVVPLLRRMVMRRAILHIQSGGRGRTSLYARPGAPNAAAVTTLRARHAKLTRQLMQAERARVELVRVEAMLARLTEEMR